MKNHAYIVSALRTPVCKAYKGAFAKTRPDDLLAHCIKAIMQEQKKLDPAKIADVIIGCAMPEAEQGMNIARIASLLAELPDSVPGMTINRFCSSGLQAIALAAQLIEAGQADFVLAGGTESMSLVPMGGYKLTYNPKILMQNKHISIAYGMGLTAEKVAEKYAITREAQDEFALLSHQRALHAIENGYFAKEIAPYWVNSRKPNLLQEHIDVKRFQVAQDEGPRTDTTLRALANLNSVFMRDGTVTAGNSSQMSDGAAAVLLASEKGLKQLQAEPMARFCGFAVAGVPPEIMGIGPVAAVPKLLANTRVAQADIDWIELNEAFAAQSLAVMQDLRLDPERVNPCGGAIALGHPLGATGAIRTATLLHGLQRTEQRYGLVSMCIGTGMGAAGLFERM
jgi:acetyl-CoA acyltransferase